MDGATAYLSDLHSDFEADVLQRLQGHNASMHGCPLFRVRCFPDGSIGFRFKGLRDGLEWEGGMKMAAAKLHQMRAFADPSAVTECALQILEQIGRADTQPILMRGNPT